MSQPKQPQLPPIGNTVKHPPQVIRAVRVAQLSQKIGKWVDPNKVRFISRTGVTQ